MRETEAARSDWSREEVELIVADYLEMLSAELKGADYSKAGHNRELQRLIPKRSRGSIEFKHANISAVMIDLGFPYISGYLPRSNYQELLYEVVTDRLGTRADLANLAVSDAVAPAVPPSVDDILQVLTDPPKPREKRVLADRASRGYLANRKRSTLNYLELEARNSSLGSAGEEFVIRFEAARLERAGFPRLASKIDRVSVSQGDGAGFDILSFEESGEERIIEVKTTKYGKETPFFVSRNELEVSRVEESRYHLYRVFEFRAKPQLFTLAGSLHKTCHIEPMQFAATVA